MFELFLALLAAIAPCATEDSSMCVHDSTNAYIVNGPMADPAPFSLVFDK